MRKKRLHNNGRILTGSTDTGYRDDQCASALCNSRLIALIVSNNTFKGIADLTPESHCDAQLSSLLLHYEMVLEILEHRPPPRTHVLPIFFKDGGVPDRFEDIDRRAFCFSDGWLANLNSAVKVQVWLTRRFTC